jgi:predicted MFS family arabinose efflux permease
MIVMPLGPDFARDLGVPLSQLGLIGGSYTAAAALAGVIGAFFLDRFDRRRALAVALGGLGAGTLLGALARDLTSLVLARVVAGAFGGPATALSLSIIADAVPPQRRGRAMGTVMSAFSLASVAGVPAGLELARVGGWRLSFVAVGALAAVAAAASSRLLPPLRDHLRADRTPPAAAQALGQLLGRRSTPLSLLMGAAIMASMFSLIPNIAAYVQGNLGFPRDSLGLLYLAGGVINYLAMRVSGPAVDRLGAFAVGTASTAATVVVIFFSFIDVPAGLSAYAVFIGLMTATAFRAVAYNTLASRVPQPQQRARFLSLQSAVQHAAAAGGAVLSSRLLVELDAGALGRMDQVAWFAIGLALIVPPLLLLVQRQVVVDEVRAGPGFAPVAARTIPPRTVSIR